MPRIDENCFLVEKSGTELRLYLCVNADEVILDKLVVDPRVSHNATKPL